MSTAQVIKGAIINLTLTLRQGGALYPIQTGSTVTAAIVGPDGVTTLSSAVSLSAGTPGANWAAGVVVAPLDAALTGALPLGDALVKVAVTYGGATLPWLIPVTVVTLGGGQSALFSRDTVLAQLRADRLVLLGASLLPGVSALPDDFLWAKILAAEADASRQLRCFFRPTVIIPEDAPQAEADALAAAGAVFAQEPAYDYDPDFFRANRWGLIVTQQRPIISVQSIQFAYPAPTSQVLNVPADWLRLDKKYGHIRMVPAGSAFSAPLSAFLMQAFGGGSTIPNMIRVRYTAGLANAAQDFPDLIDLVKKMACLRIIEDAYLPQTGTISGDGLSQSLSVDCSKYQDAVDQKLSVLRDSIQGIRVFAL